MTRKRKNSIVKKQWSHQSKQHIQKSIVVGYEASHALEALSNHLKSTVTHPYLKSAVIKPYWIEMQMPLLLPYAKEHPSYSVAMKIFVLRFNGELRYLLVEQFLEDEFDIDMTINYAFHHPNVITLYLNDCFCLGLMFEKIESYQETLEFLIMNCYEILFNPKKEYSHSSTFS